MTPQYEASCAHLRVHYDPVEHGIGTYSQRWRCPECLMEFVPDSPYYGRRGWRLLLARLIWRRAA